MAATESITKARDLLDSPGLGRCELVRGELFTMNPCGFRHGRIASRIGARFQVFVEENACGAVTGAETGFQIGHNPDTVRAPDVGFVRAERLPEAEFEGFFQGAPDLAVEVLSPHDRVGAVNAKVQDWLQAGCGLVWVADPQNRTVSVFRSGGEIVLRGESDTLDGADVLPGLALPVAEIFSG